MLIGASQWEFYKERKLDISEIQRPSASGAVGESLHKTSHLEISLHLFIVVDIIK